MVLSFIKLNHGWNAEPNAPKEAAHVDGHDLLLEFYLNQFKFAKFHDGGVGILRFVNCTRFRLGGSNDEGWYRGKCRFSALVPEWGEFYAIVGDDKSPHGPTDWVEVQDSFAQSGVHFLFYFRDRTFECVAERCVVERTQNNALFRASISIPRF